MRCISCDDTISDFTDGNLHVQDAMRCYCRECACDILGIAFGTFRQTGGRTGMRCSKHNAGGGDRVIRSTDTFS